MFFIGESTRLLIDDEEEEERDEEEVEISSFFSTLLCRSCLAAQPGKILVDCSHWTNACLLVDSGPEQRWPPQLHMLTSAPASSQHRCWRLAELFLTEAKVVPRFINNRKCMCFLSLPLILSCPRCFNLI